MFGADFDMRDVLGWLDLKGIESPSEREDYGYFAMRMKRAGERIAGA